MLRTIKTKDGRTLVPLCDGELAKLIEQSSGRAVSCAFGSSGTALIAKEAAWALPLLAQWRGFAFNEGAGI